MKLDRRSFLAAAMAAACAAPPPPPRRSLRILLGTDLPSFDPHAEADDLTSLILENVYQALVAFDANLRIVPGAALAWTNPDDLTWRFTLDPAACFPDGSRLTPQDVAFSIERARGLTGSPLQSYALPVREVRVVDERTVDLCTDTPAALLPRLPSLLMASAAFVRRHGDRAWAQGFGTGPYQVAAREAARAVLRPNPSRPAAPVAEAEFLRGSGDAMVEDVARFKPDLVACMRFDAIARLQAQPLSGYRFATAPGLFVVYAALNVRPRVSGAANPLADPRVRRALAFATDQARIAADAHPGFARPVSQMVAPPVFGFDPALPPLRFSPPDCHRLLAEAGHASWAPVVETSDDSSRLIEGALVASWQRAGLPARLEVRPDAELRARVRAGAFGIAVDAWGCTGADAGELAEALLHGREAGLGVNNETGWSHREVDTIAEQQSHVLDTRRRQVLLQTALRITAEEGPFIPLFVREDTYLVSAGIHFTPRLGGFLPLASVAFAGQG